MASPLSFRAIFAIAKYKGSMRYQGRKIKKNKKLYRHITAVVQDAEKQFIRRPRRGIKPASLFFNENQAKVQEALTLFGLDRKMDLVFSTFFEWWAEKSFNYWLS